MMRQRYPGAKCLAAITWNYCYHIPHIFLVWTVFVSILVALFVLKPKFGTIRSDLPPQLKEQAYNITPEELASFTAVAINTTFRLPTNPDYINRLPNYKAKLVRYLRNTKDIVARGMYGKCANTLEILGWIMDEANKKNGILMIAYGELIHVHREKDFVHKENGTYIDDDFDMLVSVDTVSLLGTLEPELFKRFGWTMRAFLNSQGYLVFIQIMQSCGHTPIARAGKVKSSEPVMEIYPLARSIDSPDGSSILKDLWAGNLFTESMIFPPNHISFESAATSRPLHLQIPNKPFDFLECMYGNWTVPSSQHGPPNSHCF